MVKPLALEKLAVLILALSVTASATAQSFGNASFETPAVNPHEFRSGVDTPTFLAPWYGEHSFGIANSSGSWGTGGHSGDQYAYIQSTEEFGGAGSLYQTLTGLTPGANYSVSFWMARRNGDVGGNQANPIAVFAGSTTIMNSTYPVDENWRKYTTSVFTAPTATLKITFLGQNPGFSSSDTASLIDDVQLNAEPVPEPGSCAVLAAGLLGAFRRFGRSRK